MRRKLELPLVTSAVTVLSLLVFLVLPGVLPAQGDPDETAALMKKRLAKAPEQVICAGRLICTSKVLPRFYRQRGYTLAWTTRQGPSPQADALVAAIAGAEQEGLRSRDYQIDIIEPMMADLRKSWSEGVVPTAGLRVDLDLLLTDAFLVYGSHLLSGRVDPEKIYNEWFAAKRYQDLSKVLQVALETGSVGETLQSLRPKHRGYERLKQALARYRDLEAQGPWPAVPDGPNLAKGDRGERVAALRKALLASGDLPPGAEPAGDLFDEPLGEAVVKFQKRNGLEADGTVGRATRRALNTPPEGRIRQLELNLERWRWLPADLGRRHVSVNIAAYALEVVEDEQTVLSMKVVVGKNYLRTPVFSGKMTYVEINPYWNVPESIALEEILPKVRKNPGYLKKEKIRVFSVSKGKATEVRASDVKWSELGENNFPYRLRQDPGPLNPLGKIKFMFPNKYGVYLHDTSQPELFDRTRREFSHGCIRIEKPLDMAQYVLRGDSKWPLDNVRAAIDSETTWVVNLPEPIAVHVLYWTAWVDEDGTVEFREDIYQRDETLDQAIRGQLFP